jgi:hypothetical protein
MKLHQLSLFLENRAGTLVQPCDALAAAGINLLALTLADTAEFGILRLVVKDWSRAKSVLEGAGFLVTVTEVVALEVPHEPRGLARVLDVLNQAKQTIEYMYAFGGALNPHSAVLVFRFANTDQAIASLASKGINAIAPAELFDRLNA